MNPADVESFFAAIASHDASTVERLLAAHPELLEAESPPEFAPNEIGGCRPLHVAAYVGSHELETLFVHEGCEVEARNEEGRTALHVALEYNNTTRAHLLELGLEIDASAAAALGDLARLNALLDADPDAVQDRTTELTPLSWAAFFASTAAAKLLLERGADPNDGSLCCAAMINGTDVAHILLEHGADPSATPKNFDGNAVHFAATQRYTDDASAVLELLLAHGADPKIPNVLGMSPLDVVEHNAAKYGPEKQAGFERMRGLLRGR